MQSFVSSNASKQQQQLLIGSSTINNPKQPRKGFPMKDGVISINQVLYARHFRKKRVFSGSHELVKAAKSPEISSGVVGRLIRTIFYRDDAKGSQSKRLPKRLINLVPTIQKLIIRFRDLDVEAFTKSVLRIPPKFRKFMHENQKLKGIAARSPSKLAPNSLEEIYAMEVNALKSEYLSQEDSDSAQFERKRKRREQAIESRSCASAAVSEPLLPPSSMSRKRLRMTANQVPIAGSASKSSSDLTKLREHRDEISQLGEFVVPKKVVFRLLRKFVAQVIPKEIWGQSTTKNWACVKSLLQRFVNSRKYDVMSLKECCNEMQVKGVEWMNTQGSPSNCPPNELLKRQELFQTIITWLLKSLAFPFLRNLFYITEREGASNEIVYYQREVWDVISNVAVHDLSAGVLQPVNNVTVLEQPRQLATSRLRLLPKVSGIRPLMNLSSPVDRNQRSVNKALEPLHRVLLFEADRQAKQLLGSTVRSMDEIYQRIKPLFSGMATCKSCKERLQGDQAPPALYCVSVDIERCFDTIRPRKLYRMLKKTVLEDEYLIRKHWVYQRSNLVNIGSSKSKRKTKTSLVFKIARPAFRSGDLQGFDELVAKSKKRNAVFIDGVLYDYLPKAKLLSLLKEHLLGNVVQIDDQDFVQKQGIPQGSVLSTLLCNLYYANFERKVIWRRLGKFYAAAIVDDSRSSCHHEELMRYTDDFLFVSTNLKRAQAFAKLMHEGNADYGCSVNFAKSRVNFEVSVKNEKNVLRAIPRFDQDPDDGRLGWCGMLIDPICLQVYVNYENSLTQASIPFDETKALQDFFVNKVLSSIRQRWHPLYFDSAYLSKETIQMLCLAAVRFALIVEMLPFVNHKNIKFFYQSVREIIAKTEKGVNRCLHGARTSHDTLVRVKGAQHGGDYSNTTPINETEQSDLVKDKKQTKTRKSLPFNGVQKYEVWCIGLQSFQLVLQRKQARWRKRTTDNGALYQWATLLLASLTRDLEQWQDASAALAGERERDDWVWLVPDARSAFILNQWLASATSRPR